MKLVETCGQLINPEYITDIWYNSIDRRIEITMVNGNKICFPVLDREEFEEIAKKLNPTQDTNIIDCARRIQEYCYEREFDKCCDCELHINGRCFAQPEVEDNYYNEEPEPMVPMDWEV